MQIKEMDLSQMEGELAVARVTVEVFGVVRDMVGAPSAEVRLPAPATARRVFRLLTARYPALLGPVFEPDGCTPNQYYLVNLDGRRFLQDLDEPLPQGSHLLLITAMSGGSGDATPPRTRYTVQGTGYRVQGTRYRVRVGRRQPR